MGNVAGNAPSGPISPSIASPAGISAAGSQLQQNSVWEKSKVLRSSIQARADRLAKEGYFLGGPPEHFDSVGRRQLITLLKQELMPSHKVLDVGCGCLRGGYWCTQFLDPRCYFGIEPNNSMLEIGRKQIVGADMMRAKCPSFSNRDDFDFSTFGDKFDFVVARSIWMHAAPS